MFAACVSGPATKADRADDSPQITDSATTLPTDDTGLALPTGDSGGSTTVLRVVEGTVTVRNTDDLAALGDVSEITGDLLLDSAAFTNIEITHLQRVGGTLEVRSGAGTMQTLTRLSLPELQFVGHDVDANSWMAARDFEVSALEEVGQDLSLPRTLQALGLTSLRTIGRFGSLVVAAETIRLPVLEAVEELTVGGLCDDGVYYGVGSTPPIRLVGPTAANAEGLFAYCVRGPDLGDLSGFTVERRFSLEASDEVETLNGPAFANRLQDVYINRNLNLSDLSALSGVLEVTGTLKSPATVACARRRSRRFLAVWSGLLPSSSFRTMIPVAE